MKPRHNLTRYVRALAHGTAAEQNAARLAMLDNPETSVAEQRRTAAQRRASQRDADRRTYAMETAWDCQSYNDAMGWTVEVSE